MNDIRADGVHPPENIEERGRLDSWKKIAAYFGRDVTTVQRWERREDMPVHRHVHAKQGSVYAYRSELDAWAEGRRGKLPDTGDTASQPVLSLPPEPLAETSKPPVESVTMLPPVAAPADTVVAGGPAP